MLSVRWVRRFGTTTPHIVATTTAAINKTSSCSSCGPRTIEVDEPALIKLKKERDPEKLFKLFTANACNMLVVENRSAFEDTVSRLAGAGRFDYIENLLEHQKALPQGRREGFIVRIIVLYGRAGMTKHAVNTFYDMHLYGCKRTVKSFNAALKVLAQSHDLEAFESFISDVPFRFGIELDVYSVNIVIKAFCEMGIHEKAYAVMVEMERLGITPDVITYTTLIAAFYKAKRPEIANGLWNLMVLKGCLPNAATFNVRIQHLVHKRRAWEANKLLVFMRRFKNFADEVTYNLVLKGFFNNGNLEMAMKVYAAMRDDGYKPNQRIYQTVIHYLCIEGEFDLAYTMCKDSMQKKCFPTVHTFNNLLAGLMKDGIPDNVNKAKDIYNLVLKRVPPFPQAQTDIMNSILSGSFSEILDIEAVHAN